MEWAHSKTIVFIASCFQMNKPNLWEQDQCAAGAEDGCEQPAVSRNSELFKSTGTQKLKGFSTGCLSWVWTPLIHLPFWFACTVLAPSDQKRMWEPLTQLSFSRILHLQLWHHSLSIQKEQLLKSNMFLEVHETINRRIFHPGLSSCFFSLQNLNVPLLLSAMVELV